MTRTVLVLGVVLGLLLTSRAAAQSGDGSLRGTVKDEQGAAMPGVTVSAISPALLSPSVAATDGVGNYRLISLPPLNDVDIDHRGLAYAVDRAGAGLFILEYTGSKTRPTTN